jgi:hypothetical protein
MRRWLVVVALVAAGCSDDGESADERACAAWEDHRQAVVDGDLEGDALLVDMREVADLAVDADSGTVVSAGEALRAASDGEASGDVAYADMELACSEG